MKKYIGLLLLCLFLLPSVLSAQTGRGKLVQAEFFWDTDPGQGSGFPLALQGGMNDAARSAIANTMAGLPVGLHTLNVRVQDSLLNWGPVFKTVLKIDASITSRDIFVVVGRAYWDNTPATSSALVMFNGNANNALNAFVQASPFTPFANPGMHSLHVQLLDPNGNYGAAFVTALQVEDSLTAISGKVYAARAWFNNDLGAAVNFLAADGQFSDVLESVLNTMSAPSLGLNVLQVQLRDSLNGWGPVFKTSLLVENPIAYRNINVAMGMAYWNNDTSQVAANLLAFDNNYGDALEAAIATGISANQPAGLHPLSVRFQDVAGNWGASFTSIVSVENSIVARSTKVVEGEVSVDLLPAITVVALNGSFQDAVATAQSVLISSGVNVGLHTLNVRMKGVDGSWGPYFKTAMVVSPCATAPFPVITYSEPLSFCHGDSIMLSAGSGFNSYQWILNNAVVGNSPDFIATVSGSYTVVVTDTTNCPGSSLPVIVDVHKPAPVIVGDSEVCDNALDSLFVNAGFSSYQWSTGSTLASTPISTGGIYTVTVTDQLGCSGVDTISIVTLSQPLVPSIIANGPLAFCQGSSVVLDCQLTQNFVWSNGVTTQQLFTDTTGSYSVIVTGTNGCTAQSSVVNTLLFPDIQAGISDNNNGLLCADGQLVLAASPGLSYQWSNGSTASFIIVSVPGDYSVAVTDTNGCVDTSAMVTVNPVPAIPVITVNGPLDFCNGNSVLLTSSSPVNNIWSTGSVNQSVLITSSAVVTDTVFNNFGCKSVSAPVVVNVHPVVSISSSGSLTVCDGDTVNLSAVAGTPVNYLWFDGSTGSSVSLTASEDSAWVIATEINGGCSDTAVVSVLVNELPVGSIAADGPTEFCSGNSVTLTTSGDSNTIYYWFLNGVQLFSTYYNTWTGQYESYPITGYSLNVIHAGSYSAQIVDTLTGCASMTNSISVVVNSAIKPTISAVGGNTICLGDSVTLISSVAEGYLWSTGDTTQTTVVSSSDYYYVVITDANGCTNHSDSLLVTFHPVAGIAASNGFVLCDGETTDLSVTPAGSYLWSDGSTGNTIAGVGASSVYTVTVTDVFGCSSEASASVVVNSLPSGNIYVTTDSVLCSGEYIHLLTSGSANTKFRWYSNSSPILSYSAPNYYFVEGYDYYSAWAGAYSALIIDTLTGCTSMSNVIDVSVIDLPLVHIDQLSSVLCFGDMNASLEATGLNTSGPYSYLWSNGTATSLNTGLTAGVYVVTVTDSFGCSSDSAYIISQPTALNPVLYSPVNTRGYNVSCSGASDALVSVVAGGTSPYSYVWSNGESGAFIDSLAIGSYSLVLTDANGCVDSADISLSEPPALQLTLSSTIYAGGYSMRCSDTPDSVLAVASGGTGPFTFLWSDNQTTAWADSLLPGTYYVTAADSEGCTVSASYTVTAPPALTLSAIAQDYAGYQISCFGASDGVISTLVSGGVGPYTYVWADTVYTPNRSGLDTGTYTLTVLDTNLCMITESVVINGPTQLLAFASGSHLDCYGMANGVAQIDSVIGGDGPYGYNWSSGGATLSDTGLTAGNYYITVTDSRNCTVMTTATVTQPAQLVAYAFGTYVACGSQIGLLSGSAIGGTGGYSFLWSNGSVSEYQSNIPVGNYTLTVTDSLGCIDTASTIILNPPVLVSSITSVIDSIGTTLTANVSGGVSPFMFLWSNGGTSATVVIPAGQPSALYTVIVTDANGCTSTGSVFVTGTSCGLTVDVIPVHVSCFGGSDGSASAIVTNAVGNVQYQWLPGLDSSVSINNLSVGEYIVKVTDSLGCLAYDTIQITQPSELEASLSLTSPILCNGGLASLQIAAVGGIAPYTGVGSYSVSAGNYSYTVTDSNGCLDSVGILVSEPAVLFVDLLLSADSICEGDGVVADFMGTPDADVVYVLNGVSDTVHLNTLGNAQLIIPNPDSLIIGLQSIYTNDCSLLLNDSAQSVYVAMAQTWYLDADGDGYYSGVPQTACVSPGAGYVSATTLPGDCNDSDSGIHPGAVELCNNIDDDCNGIVDDNIIVQTDTISGSVAQCIPMAAGVRVLSVPPVPGVINYVWSVPAGMNIVNGQGSNSITVSWTTMNAHDGIIGDVCVMPVAVCGQSIQRCKKVDLNYTMPVRPNSISGAAKVCPGDVVVYSVAPVARASSYQWTLLPGMTILSAADANVITVSIGNGFTGGSISVNAVNACGSGPVRVRNVSLNSPTAPVAISGPSNGVCNASGVIYSVMPVVGATSYTWTIPSGAVLVNGQGTSTVELNFSGSFSGGQITVVANNGCGTGSARTLSISGAPPQPGPVSGDQAICPNETGVAYAVATASGASVYTWTVPPGAVIASGQGTKNITVNFGVTTLINQSVTVVASNSCGNSSVRSLNGVNVASQFCVRTMEESGVGVMVYPNPSKGAVTVYFDKEITDQTNMILTDARGEVVVTYTLKDVVKGQSMLLELDNLASGVYILQLISIEKTERIRLVIE